VKAKQKWWQEIRGLLSLLAFVAGVGFIFQSFEIALLITAALGIHELGHVLAVSLFGIEWDIGFGVAGAWISTPRDDRRTLSHFENTVIHLAGPAFSLLYAVLAVVIHLASGLNQDYWLRLADLSATIGLLNVLPIGRVSDGGKAIQRVFASLDERAERWLLPAPILWIVSLLWVVSVTPYNWIGILAFGLIGVWFVIGLLRESLRDDPRDAQSVQAMTRNQGFLVISYMVILMVATTAIMLLTPLWLTEDHVVAMVRGWAGTVIRPVLAWLQSQWQVLKTILPGD